MVNSSTLASLMAREQEGEEEVAEEGKVENAEQEETAEAKELVEDSWCVVPVVGLVVAQFHSLEEVRGGGGCGGGEECVVRWWC